MQRFDHFMAQALYGPDGFYRSGRGVAGRRGGDFITSPEVGPLFGLLVGRWLDRVWTENGRPDEYSVFDLGSGPGTLTRAIARAPLACSNALEIQAVDIASDTDLPDDLWGTVIVANELLDNIPFRWKRSVDGQAFEAFVDQNRLVWQPTDDTDLPNGESPLLEQAASLVQGLLDRRVAHLLAFDYGALTTAELARRGGWLRCYRSHERNDDPLYEPGLWDITTDIAIDQLPAPTTIQTQAQFCNAQGVDDLVAEGRSYWLEHAARPDLRAVEMRSRANEAAALTDPTGLGAFLVMEWTR